MCISLCTTVVHKTAQSSSDYLPSYPPDKHQSSDAVYWKGKGSQPHRSYAKKHAGPTETVTSFQSDFVSHWFPNIVYRYVLQVDTGTVRPCVVSERYWEVNGLRKSPVKLSLSMKLQYRCSLSHHFTNVYSVSLFLTTELSTVFITTWLLAYYATVKQV